MFFFFLNIIREFMDNVDDVIRLRRNDGILNPFGPYHAEFIKEEKKNHRL